MGGSVHDPALELPVATAFVAGHEGGSKRRRILRNMTRSPGRPAVGPRISLRLDDRLLERVDAEAKRSGKSRAATIRELLGVSAGNPGVDVAQIRRALALTPAERIRAVARTEAMLAGLRGRAAP